MRLLYNEEMDSLQRIDGRIKAGGQQAARYDTAYLCSVPHYRPWIHRCADTILFHRASLPVHVLALGKKILWKTTCSICSSGSVRNNRCRIGAYYFSKKRTGSVPCSYGGISCSGFDLRYIDNIADAPLNALCDKRFARNDK